jgi:hypothetical protein
MTGNTSKKAQKKKKKEPNSVPCMTSLTDKETVEIQLEIARRKMKKIQTSKSRGVQ